MLVLKMSPDAVLGRSYLRARAKEAQLPLIVGERQEWGAGALCKHFFPPARARGGTEFLTP